MYTTCRKSQGFWDANLPKFQPCYAAYTFGETNQNQVISILIEGMFNFWKKMLMILFRTDQNAMLLVPAPHMCSRFYLPQLPLGSQLQFRSSNQAFMIHPQYEVESPSSYESKETEPDQRSLPFIIFSLLDCTGNCKSSRILSATNCLIQFECFANSWCSSKRFTLPWVGGEF